MSSNIDSFEDINKTIDYFMAMIRSYYPEYQPSELDKRICREAVYEMFLIDNRNFEQLKDVIDFISMNSYWRQNISNLKQVRNRYHDIMRDIKAANPVKKQQNKTDGIVEGQLKNLVNKKKEAKKN